MVCGALLAARVHTCLPSGPVIYLHTRVHHEKLIASGIGRMASDARAADRGARGATANRPGVQDRDGRRLSLVESVERATGTNPRS